MFKSLRHFKHNVLLPLQESWQTARVLHRFPQLEPVIQAYQRIYPYSGATTSLSVDERASKGIEDDTLTYGETRWTTFLEILDQLKLQPGDRFIDLGCGAGFLCLLVSQGYGIQATGVDLIEGFVNNAQKLVDELELKNISYQQKNFFELDFRPYNVFYATCTCFPEQVLKDLALKFRDQAPGSLIVTVTFGLAAPWLKTLKQIECKYSWGTDTVYITQRV